MPPASESSVGQQKSENIHLKEARPVSPSRSDLASRIAKDRACSERIVAIALEMPELSPHELATRFTDAEGYFVSEASDFAAVTPAWPRPHSFDSRRSVSDANDPNQSSETSIVLVQEVVTAGNPSVRWHRQGNSTRSPTMTTKTERDQVIHVHWQARMENDFAPDHTPEQTPEPSLRLAIAAEYAAFQLGQINRKLDKLIEAFESAAQK